jgi:putative peptidoglycan lipid II flippase
MSTKSLLRSTGIIGLGTAASRVLGFARDILIANFFGTGISIQAFVVAFKIPNLLRHFVAEGAANSAIVPVLSEYLVTKKKEEYWHLVSVLLNIMTLVLAVIVLIGVAAAPFIVRAIAPGFVTEPHQLKLAVDLLRTLFPYIFLIGLAAYSMGVLNSMKHFTAPALAPVLLNLSMITAILIFRGRLNVAILAGAALVGGFLQLIIQIPVLYKMGMRIRIPSPLKHPAAGRILKLLVPRLMGATVYQLNVLVDTVLASLHWIVGAGGIAALYYSNRLIQLPTAVFGISLATAALPTLSAHFTKGDMEGFKDTLNFSLKGLFIIMIPAAVGLVALGDQIIRVLFERGEFGAYSTMITSQAMAFYAIGLFSYAGIKILVFCFYSMQDTMTPLKTASISLGINLALNLLLMWPLKIGGLALATSIAGIINFTMLLYLLRKRIGDFGQKDLITFLIKTFAAAAVMGAALYAGAAYFGRMNIAYLIFSIAAGIAIYFIMLHILGVKEPGKFAKWALRIK